MSDRLHVRLLGGFALTYDGARIPPIEKSARLRSLLVYLLLNASRPQPRRQIAFSFWPDTTESQARTNLRKLVYQLQRRLPDSARYLRVDGYALQWNEASSYQLDVDLLEDALQKAEQDPSVDDPFDDIIRLYKGPLLPALGDDWLNERRQALQLRVVSTLTKRAAYCERRALFHEATAVVQRLLLLDPFEEAFYQGLMRLRALADDRNGAIRAYQSARMMLQEELGVPPSPRTELLYERIVSGQVFWGRGENARRDQPSLPLIDRHSEWVRLQAVTAALQPGHSRCVWISGEAGIGKTRLAEELLAWAYLDGYLVARTRSYSAHGNLAYAPIAQLFRRSELTDRLDELDDVWLSQISRILPELHEQRPDLPAPGPLSQGGERVRFFDALCKAILAGGQPVVLLFDDLQWCDEETLSWLHYLLRHEHDSQMLVVGAYRDDEIGPNHPLNEITNSLYREGQLSDIGLIPLTEEDAVELAQVVYEDELNSAAQQELIGDTGGNPLFVVETVRAHLSGVHDETRGRYSRLRPDASVDLPPKIYALIQYRLGRLSPPAQEVLKVAALIGRSFEDILLLAVAPVAEEEVADAISELSDKRVLREQKAGIYDFRHDKLRDVTLEQIGGTEKRLLSRHIAAAYESLYDERRDDIVGELAVAHEGAGQYREAVSYYHQAAQAETRRGAYYRAEAYIEKALALIDEVADSGDWAETELTLQLSLANLGLSIQLSRLPKVRAAYVRALELSEATGDQAGRMEALWGLSHYHLQNGDMARARDYGRQSILVTEQIGDQVRFLGAYLIFGLVSLIRGEFQTTKESMELVLSRYNSDVAEPLTTLQGFDGGVAANIFLSCAQWFLGYPEQSDETMALAQATAEELGTPINLFFVANYRMLMSLIKHDLAEMSRNGDELIKISEQHDVVFAGIMGQTAQAYVTAARDPGNSPRIEAFAEQLILFREQVSPLSQPLLLSLKVRLLVSAARYKEAQGVLAQAFEVMDAVDDRYSEVEIHRLQGELWTITGEGDPEAAYLRAIAVAEEQEQKMCQIRAVVSLCRLWQRQGKQKVAHRLLSDLYSWFNEGFATRDLQEARELLDELERSQ